MPIGRSSSGNVHLNFSPSGVGSPILWIDAETGITGTSGGPTDSAKNQVGVGVTYPQYRGCDLVGGGAQGSWEGWTGANVSTRNPGQGPQTPANYKFVVNSDVDYCVSKGMNTFRVLFNHEAIQPEANATIPYAGGLPNPTRYSAYYTTFKALIDYITITKGKVAIIDIHNAEGTFPTGWCAYYLRQFSMTPSGTQETGNTLANLYSQLGTIFLSNPNVWFGIINEPTISSTQWYPVAQAVITAIRATGNTNKIVMPGINTDGARDWYQNGADTGWEGLTDSANNMVAQVHNYFDPDNSGTQQIAPNTTYEPDMFGGLPATATNLGSARFTYVTNRARTKGYKIFIGEMGMDVTSPSGGDQTAQMTATWRNTISFINANADVILGYCWWEYGSSGWAGNIFDLRQASGPVDNARMNVIKGDFISSISGGSSLPLLSSGADRPTWNPGDFKSGTKHSIQFIKTSGGATASPTAYAMTGLFLASYTGVPWSGTASTGTSSSFTLDTAGLTNPSVGAAVNGYTPADFVSGGAILQPNAGATHIEDFFGNTSTEVGSFFCLFYARTAAAPGGGVYQDGNIFTDVVNADISFGITTSGFSGQLYSAAHGNVQVTVACSTGAWHFGQVKWDGTNLYVRVDNGAWSSSPAGYFDGSIATGDSGAAIYCGYSYGGASIFNGLVLAMGMSKTAIPDGDFDKIGGYLQAQYALSLGFSGSTAGNHLSFQSPVTPTFLPNTYDGSGIFTLNSGQSDYFGYKPDTYSDATPINLFVWMHGCGGNAYGDVFSIAPTPTRSTQSYIAISIGGRDGDCWSVNVDTPKVMAAVADIKRYYNINPSKIYIGGYSSGGDLAYRVGFPNANTFAAILIENSDPYRDTGVTEAVAIASAQWKINIIHLCHLSDGTYPITQVRAHLADFAAAGFPVTKIEKAGTHYDPDSGMTGTDYDRVHFLMPYLETGLTGPNTAVAGTGFSTGASFWVVIKYTSTDTTATNTINCPLTLFGYSGTPNVFSVGFSAGTPRYVYKIGGTTTNHNSSITGLNDGKYHTVAWTHSTAGVVSIYVDGVLTDTFTGITYNVAGQIDRVGSGYLDTDNFEGSVAEAMAWNGVITDLNVRSLQTRASETWG